MPLQRFWMIGFVLLVITIWGVLPFLQLQRIDDLLTTLSIDDDEELLQKIREEAKRYYEEPVDAKVDRVWKAIPGYNGLEVDVEKTLEYAKKLKGNLPLVFREIPPKVNIEDLGPQPIYKGNPRKPMVAIMVNVAWGNEYIPEILDIFQQEQVQATFFLDGSWLTKNLDVAQEIANRGHELSNHAYSHKNMSQLSRQAAIEEIMKTQQLLKQHFQLDNKWFAPPSGDFDDETLQIVHELDLQMILWTLDTVDWKNPDPSWIVTRIAANVEPGSLILMHPTLSSSKALPAMIQEIKNKGLVLGTVSDLISPNRIFHVESPIHFW